MRILKVFHTPIIVLGLASIILFSESCYGMEVGRPFNENGERNWRQSLNVYDDKGSLLLNADDWFSQTLPSINENTERDIRSKFQKLTPVEQNIAIARFTIIYTLRGEGNLIFSPLRIPKIFVSGLNSLDLENEVVRAQNLQDKIVFPISFINGPRPTGREIDRIQKDRVNEILGREIVNSGTHAEESIVIHIFDSLRGFMDNVKNKRIAILGSILEISSLKDPCSGVCVPMLKGFMENLHHLLSSHARGMENIDIIHPLENLVLLSGRKSHIQSREGIEVRGENIVLNLDSPSNRIFSRKID